MAEEKETVIAPPELQIRTTTTATLIIPKRVGHRHILKDIFQSGLAAGEYIDVKIGARTMFRIPGELSTIHFIRNHDYKTHLGGALRYIATAIPDFPFPNAAEDEDLVLQASATPTLLTAIYEDVTIGELKSKTVLGGSLAKKQFFIHWMTYDTAIGATGTYSFNKAVMPTGLDGFIDKYVTPANQLFTCYIIAADVPKSGESEVRRIHIWDEFTELFTTETGEGIPVELDTGNLLEFDTQKPNAFILPKPYEFQPQRTLRFQMDAYFDGTNSLPANSQKLFLIGIREFL